MPLPKTAMLAVAALLAAAPAATAQDPLPSPQVLVKFKFTSAPKFTQFRQIELTRVPSGSKVVVRCLTSTGARCGGTLHKAFTATDASGTVEITRFEHKRIPAGRSLEATITNPAYATEYKTIAVRRHALPKITTQCSQPGSNARGAC